MLLKTLVYTCEAVFRITVRAFTVTERRRRARSGSLLTLLLNAMSAAWSVVQSCVILL